MPFGLSLILHPANSFKKGKVPIVKQMLPVMVRSVCATKYTVEHLRKTIAKHWGTSRRHTRVDTDGCCRPWTFHKNGSAQKKQSLYSGDTKVFVIKIMLISLFSPGARQSFFSTITQSAGHRSVYLHCV